MSARKTRLAGVLLFCGMWSIALAVVLPVLYVIAMAGATIFDLIPVMFPLAIGLEWILGPMLTLSLCMMVGE